MRVSEVKYESPSASIAAALKAEGGSESEGDGGWASCPFVGDVLVHHHPAVFAAHTHSISFSAKSNHTLISRGEPVLQLESTVEDLAVRRAVEAAVDVSAGEPGLPRLSAVEEVYFAAWKTNSSPQIHVR